jgi:hypothetical protein
MEFVQTVVLSSCTGLKDAAAWAGGPLLSGVDLDPTHENAENTEASSLNPD